MEVMDEPSRQGNRVRGSWMDWLAYLGLRSIVCLIQSLSLESCDRSCQVLAVALERSGLRRTVIRQNLQLAYGTLADAHQTLLSRKMWHNLLLMVCEIAHAPRKIHRTNWRDHFYMPHKQSVFELMMDDRATVLVTGHFGNFEVAGHIVGLIGAPPATIARPLDNPYVDAYLTRFRSSEGQKILPKEGSAIAVQELLEEHGTLALLADQHAGGKGCWVDFFGHPTSCHKALALFVLSAKAPMIVNYTRRSGSAAAIRDGHDRHCRSRLTRERFPTRIPQLGSRPDSLVQRSPGGRNSPGPRAVLVVAPTLARGPARTAQATRSPPSTASPGESASGR